MKIEVLGTGCTKCHTLMANVKEAVAKKGIFAQIDKVEDIMKIMAYNVLTTPVLMIDEEMKVKGRVADVNEIKELLK